MRPGLEASVIETVGQPHVQLAVLFEFDLPGDPAYLFTGWGRLEVAGKTYLGTGQFGRIAEARETVNGRVSGAVYQLSGVGTPEGRALFAALRAAPDDTPVRQLVVFFDPVAGAAVGAPILLRDDRFDTFGRTLGAGDVVLTLTAEPVGMDRGLQGFARYTPQSHKEQYPDDTGLDLQPQVGKAIFDMDASG